ncbi:MAG: cyclic nucleotide-binding domain-containing protein [Mariprofundaceae bacterium]|nr:cyclic nucleotide-binding domain-containing protein [Mariprofundaceae bacterium]
MGKSFVMSEGDILCEAGDPSHMLWLLESGKLGVQLPEYLEDGEDELSATDELSVLVGELGFFTRQRRSAKVWAKEVCQIYQISFEMIDSCDDLAFQQAMQALLKHYWMYPILSKHAIFERINDVDRRALCDLFVPIDMAPGECLIHHGEDHDGAYLLQQGCLFFMYESETGKEHVSSMVPGDIVHLGGLLHAYHANYEVCTATAVRLLHISRQHMERFLKTRPWMVDVLLRYSRRPAWRQIMRPDDAYLWMTNREIKHRAVSP